MMENILEKLNKEGKVTPYLYERVKTGMKTLPDDLKKDMLDEAIHMSSMGVNSADDYKNIFYISRHINKITGDLSKEKLPSEHIKKVFNIVYANRSTYPIDTVSNFYDAVKNALVTLKIPIKNAYPQGQSSLDEKSPYNIQKWMQSTREIYEQMHRGMQYNEAFKSITNNWDVMEKQSFEKWLKFYREDAHNKYKTAQRMYYTDVNGAPMAPLDDLKGIIGNKPDETSAPVNKKPEKTKQEILNEIKTKT
jgi:hypothetical protein